MVRPPRVWAACAASLVCATAASAQVVINEVYYDAPGSDDGQVFVELFGPAGTDISGWKLQSIEGGTGNGGTCNPQVFTFPAGTLIPASGFVVVADTTSTGTTTVPNPTFTTTNMDLENGPDALQLLDANGIGVDAVAYGPVDTSGGAASACNGQPWYEGSPARDVFAPLSIERCVAGRDTNNNATDFIPNVPTPGRAAGCCRAIEWVDMGSGSTLSTTGAGKVGLDVFLSCAANRPYLLLASFTDPAAVPPPPPFPVFDASTAALATVANIPPFVAWLGTLDATGSAVGAASLDFTGVPIALPAAVPMYIGAVGLDSTGQIVGSNHVTITLQ